MFTGIVQGKARIEKIIRKVGFQTHIIAMPTALLEGLSVGASVAHNGVCLTVTEINGALVSFDLMAQTLAITNLRQVQEGDEVNIERAMKMGTEIGGHLLSGHIFCTATIAQIERTTNNYKVRFHLPSHAMKYVLAKGFIAIDGASLTIVDVDRTDNTFSVSFIPETLERTIIAQKREGEQVNIEIDSQTQAIIDTVERYLAQNLPING
ncbi:riboflavin synthase subunit alpha [Pasteurellaceae bacterium HPA106]|uniref:riboflavin synthase subunit alpha n=1 Tax=Spirabiliibacterium pneumoniae TaxID=221400 RepID=UPI001AAD73E5|nr:riboflavin synthase subunit alpha [Spirabiliibacterium pneumoniae]MBE2896183.1 riboflavin synthase subunit alpha [Spirabiliibacterium pneumoniae]